MQRDFFRVPVDDCPVGALLECSRVGVLEDWSNGVLEGFLRRKAYQPHGYRSMTPPIT